MKKIIFIGCCLFLLFFNALYSQNVQQDEQMIIYSEESDIPRRVGYNALDYFEQKRYRPDYSLFSHNRFADNVSIGIFGGISGIAPRGQYTFDPGVRLGIYALKYFSPYSGFKLSGSVAGSKNRQNGYILAAYNISADYEFNLSSYINGYNPYRVFQFISSQGVGYNYSKCHNERAGSYDLHWGLKFLFATKSQVNFFVEPRLTFYTDDIDLSHNANWRGYDIGYAALMGLDYSFGNSMIGSGHTVKYTGWNGLFVGFSGGVTTLLNGISDEIGLRHALGPSLTFSVGKWFSSFAGTKASLFSSFSSWQTIESSSFVSQALFGGGRFELIFNPFGFSERTRDSRFTIEPNLGLEFGMSYKQNRQPGRRAFVGATAALQFKYKLYPDLAFYIEPRYSVMPYRNINNSLENINDDKAVTLNFGVEAINLGRGTGNNNIFPREVDRFTPHFFFSAGVGGAMVVQQRHYINRTASHMANIGLGYWFNSVSGLRLDGNLGTLVSRMPKDHAQINVSASLNYALNIVNLLAGYDSDRRWDADIFLGPLFGYVSKCDNPAKLNFGVQGGGRLSYKLTGNFDFYVEPRMHLYTSRLFPAGTGSPAIANLNFGGTYHFAYRGIRPSDVNAGNGFLDNTFLGVSMGAVNSFENFTSGLPSDKVMNATGAEYALHLGKWLTPFIGLRTSLFGNFYSHSIGMSENEPDRINLYAGTGLEFMFNPFRLGNHGKSFLFELVPSLGIRASVIYRQMNNTRKIVGNVTSFTAAMQLRYNVADNMALVLEPRWMRTPFSDEDFGKISENMLAVSFGVELTHHREAGHKGIAIQRKGYRRYAFVSVNGGMNSNIVSTRYNGIKMGYIAGIGGGYSLTPSSAFRLGYDISMLPPVAKTVEKPQFHSHNITVNYMFDLSNFICGYNPDRKVGFRMFAGPVFSFQGKGVARIFRVGAEAGGIGYVNLTDRLSFDLQPKARAFNSSTRGDRIIFRQLMFDFTAGLTYKF